MAGKSNTTSSESPKLGGIQVQTALYGLAIPLYWGRVRIGGNLLWYGDFTSIPVIDESQSGGKGGASSSQTTTNWRYEAALVLSLGLGPVNGITAAWKGKKRFDGVTGATRTRTLTHRVTVPGDGIVTVPSAASFAANVAVRNPNNETPGLEGAGA